MPVKTRLAKGVTFSCVTVSNLKKARHLFVDLLGLEVRDYQEEHRWMEVGGYEGSLIRVGQESQESCNLNAGSNAVISIEVFNLEDAIKHLNKQKVKFHGEIIEVPQKVKMILFEDFDGNRFFLTQTLSLHSKGESP